MVEPWAKEASAKLGCCVWAAFNLEPWLAGICRLPIRRSPSKLCATLDLSRRLRMDESRAAIFSPPKLILIVALAAVVLPWASSSMRAETGAVMIAIDRMTVGSSPDGFTFARTGQSGAAQWTVTADPTATSGRAIEQTSTDRTDYRFPLAIYEAVSISNLIVSVRFRAVAGN